MQVMTGPVLAELIETMVGALNARDIPTAGSILEHFNRELVQKAGLLHNATSPWIFFCMSQICCLPSSQHSWRTIPAVGTQLCNA